jgi:hypothetical protein
VGTPAFFLGFHALLHRFQILREGLGVLLMLPFGLETRSLSFLNRGSSLLAGFRSFRLFLRALLFALTLFICVFCPIFRPTSTTLQKRPSSPWPFSLRGRASSDAADGSSACSLKAELDPTALRRTMPGFAIAAAITASSSDSFATP